MYADDRKQDLQLEIFVDFQCNKVTRAYGTLQNETKRNGTYKAKWLNGAAYLGASAFRLDSRLSCRVDQHSGRPKTVIKVTQRTQ